MTIVLAQFVAPELPLLAAGGLAVTAVPIVIHMLTRLRRRPVAWGAMRFLLEAYRRHRSRLRLEQWLLLLVRCLILVILGLALSGRLESPRTRARLSPASFAIATRFR